MEEEKDIMKNKETNSDILENDHLKKMPFSVPRGYFESVEDEVRSKIKEQTPDGQWGLLHRSLKAYLGLAASFLLILGAGWGVIHLTKGLSEHRMESASNVIDSEQLLDSLENEYVAGQLDEALAKGGSDDSLNIKVIPPQAETNPETDAYYNDAVEEYLRLYPSASVSLASLEFANLEQ